MISLIDKRKELYQWDTGVAISVPAECSQVHFANKIFGRSIDVDVKDGKAIIPDVLLQSDNDLNVWAFVGELDNGYTKISKIFKVNKRNKPADYVFTPPEQTTLEEIQKEINAQKETVAKLAEKITDNKVAEQVKRLADEYLKKYDTQADFAENNETSPAFVKNRTHYEKTAMVEIMPATKLTGYLDTEGLTYSKPNAGVTIKENTLYKIIFNGVEYTELSTVMMDGAQIGDGGTKPFADIPFWVMSASAMNYIMWNADLGANVTITIYEEQIVVKPIDEKYLPESVGSVVMRSSTKNSTKMFKITVDDSGQIIVKEVTG